VILQGYDLSVLGLNLKLRLIHFLPQVDKILAPHLELRLEFAQLSFKVALGSLRIELDLFYLPPT
jgi:hypothetical protein